MIWVFIQFISHKHGLFKYKISAPVLQLLVIESILVFKFRSTFFLNAFNGQVHTRYFSIWFLEGIENEEIFWLIALK